MLLVSGLGSEKIEGEIADQRGVEVSAVEHRVFPDGENYIRLTTEVRGHDVVLIHSTAPPQDTRLIQLMLTLDAIREGGASSVAVVAPYLAYARQDRSRLPGEAVSVSTVIRLLRCLGVSKLVTVNVHNPTVFDGSGLELVDLSAIPLLASHLRDEGLGGSFSLSLGKKPVDQERAREAAEVLGGDHGRLETFRDPETGEVSLGRAGFDVDGRRVAVFDDVITSGGTHLKVVELIKEAGAAAVHLAVVHSLLPEERLRKVLDAVDSFTCTDTIPNRFSRVGVAPLISEAIRV